MTFEELEAKVGHPQKRAGWHQHKNGGGWVSNSTVGVRSAFFIDSDSIIFSGTFAGDPDRTRISISKSIIHNGRFKNCVISESTIHSGTFGDGTYIERCVIHRGSFSCCSISDSTIRNGVFNDNMEILGGSWNNSPTIIRSDLYGYVYECSPGCLMIGGYGPKSIDWWLSNLEGFALAQELSEKEVNWRIKALKFLKDEKLN